MDGGRTRLCNGDARFLLAGIALRGQLTGIHAGHLVGLHQGRVARLVRKHARQLRHRAAAAVALLDGVHAARHCLLHLRERRVRHGRLVLVGRHRHLWVVGVLHLRIRESVPNRHAVQVDVCSLRLAVAHPDAVGDVRDIVARVCHHNAQRRTCTRASVRRWLQRRARTTAACNAALSSVRIRSGRSLGSDPNVSIGSDLIGSWLLRAQDSPKM